MPNGERSMKVFHITLWYRPTGRDNGLRVVTATVEDVIHAITPETTTELLNDIINLAKFGNLNALTDLLGSAELAYSSSKIASLNVRINLDSINSGDQKEDLNGQVLELTLLTKERYELINKIIMERLQWK